MLGVWYTILSVLNWVVLFDLGLGQGLRNQLPKALYANNLHLAKEYISTTYISMSFVAVVISAIGMAIIPHVDLFKIFNLNSGLIDYKTLEYSVSIVFIGIMIQIVLKIITSILYAMQRSAVVNFLALCTNLIILIALLLCPSGDINNNLIRISWINVLSANVPYVLCSIWVFSYKGLKGAAPSIRCFSKKYIKDIFNVGIALLWLQVVFMVVSSANEFLISNLTAPRYVVEYQAYFKIFKTAAMVVSLALTPIWSAVTKAQIEKNFVWIKKVYILFLGISGLCLLGEICLISILQWGMDMWLGEGTITVTAFNAFIFSLSSVIFVLHSVNTSIGNGLSYFRLQMVWMTVASVVFIPLACMLVRLMGSWIGVVLANILAMTPYEILAPIYTIRKLNKMQKGVSE